MRSIKYYILVFISALSLQVFAQECEWLEASTSSSNSYIAVATDENEDVIVSGSYSNPFSIQHISFPAPPYRKGGFIAKFDNKGTVKWVKNSVATSFGTVDSIYQIVTDDQNNIYAMGVFSGSIDFGNGVTVSTTKTYINPGLSATSYMVVKFDSLGIAQWANVLEDTSAGHGGGGIMKPKLAVSNSSHNVFVGFTIPTKYRFSNTTQTLSAFIQYNSGSLVIYNVTVGVVKYDANGNFIATKRFGDVGYNIFDSFGIDGNDNLYISATTYRGSAIAPQISYQSGSTLFKIDSAFNYINSRVISVGLFTVDYFGTNMYVQPNGKFVLTGRFGDTVDFGGIIGIAENGYSYYNNSYKTGNLFIIYYDSSLTPIWVRKENTLSQREVALSNGGAYIRNGFIFFGGHFGGGETRFGASSLIPVDSTYTNRHLSTFLVKMDTLGNFLWAFTSGDGKFESIAIDKHSNAFIAAHYFDSVKVFNKSATTTGIGYIVAKIKDYRITRGYVSSGPYCAGDSFDIPYTKYGRYDSGNQFIAQLSDSAGNFDGGERELGRITSTEDGTVKGKLPLFNVASNNKYRIRILSTNPVVQSFYKKDTLQLLIYSKDTANAGPDQTLCTGQPIRLGTTGGTQWEWTPAQSLSNPSDSSNRQPLIALNTTTEYRIIISDSSGCGVTDTDYVKINIRPPLHTTIQGDSTICRGYKQTLHAQVSGGDSTKYWYIWKTVGFNIIQSKTPNLTILPASTTQYQVIVGDSCSSKIDTTYFTVTVQNNLKAKITGDTAICLGNTITLNATGIGCNPNKYTFEWFQIGNPNAISNNDSITISPTTSTQYSVILKDTSTLLVDTAHIKITVYQPLHLTINTDTTICTGEAAELRATITGGNPNTRHIKWTVDRGQWTSSTPTTTVSPQKTTTYKALLSDGCSPQNDSAAITITVRPKLTLTLNPDTTICIGEAAELRATPTGGNTAKHTLLWTVDRGQWTDSNNTIQVSPTTTTVYKALLTDNCTTPSDSAELTVTVRPKLSITVTPDTTICTGETLTLAATAKGGNPNTYSIIWTANNQQQSTNNNITVSPTQTTTYKALLSDGCTQENDSSEITITVRAPLQLKTSAKDSICANQTLLLTATPSGGLTTNHQIQWTVDNGLWTSTQNPATDTPKINTKYIVQLSDNCSPTVYDTLTVTVLAIPQADFSYTPTQGCPPLTVTITDNSTGNDTTQNRWAIHNTEYQSTTTIQHQFTQTGTYPITLNVTNQLGCYDQKTQANAITVYPKPKAALLIKPEIKEVEEPIYLYNQSSDYSSILWNMGDGNTLYPKQDDTIYQYNENDTGKRTVQLIAINSQGCKDTASQTILVYDKIHCTIPSAFTPNQDQLNNTFSPVCVGVAYYSLTIYNRWGQIIYNQDNGVWDGTYSGEPVPAGIYLYKIQIQADNKKKKLTYGTVQVIR